MDGPGKREGEPQPLKRDRVRRAYKSPKLIEYGSAAKLTKGVRSVQIDGSAGRYKRTCL